jgi:hypothetical protein
MTKVAPAIANSPIAPTIKGRTPCFVSSRMFVRRPARKVREIGYLGFRKNRSGG